LRWKVTAIYVLVVRSNGRASTAGARSERKVGDDEHDRQEREPRRAHQAGARDVSRAFRFDAGDGGNGSDQNGEAKPREPAHDDSIHVQSPPHFLYDGGPAPPVAAGWER
jgi:hypothetical protein